MKKPLLLTLGMVWAALVTFSALNAQPKDLGPAIGSVLPHSLESVDQDGNAQSFETLKGEKGAVLVFFRSADWCPFCQRQLIDLNSIDEAVTKQGYAFVALSYDAPETLAKFKERRAISYPLLSDKNSEIIKSLGILNDSYQPGHFAHGVPHPIVLVLDSNGVVTHKFFREGYKERPEKEVILSAVSE